MVTGLPSLDALQQAFGYVESSNRYDAIGPRTRRGNNAYGRYQVMDFNVPSWTEQYFGQRLTPQQFLGNPQAQDAVFYGRMGEYYNRGQGTPEDRVRNAASLWFTGQPYSAETAGRSDGFINNQEYGDRILRALGSAPQGASTMSMNPDPQPQGLFGGIGQGLRNMFGGGQPDPNAGNPTDPFEGLSRAQRTMLGFAALRDAAAALEGRDSSFFNEALGGFEAARERERLRAQGEYANRNNAIDNLIQLEALASQLPENSGLQQLVNVQRELLLGQVGLPSGTSVTGMAGAGGATPMPVDFAGGTLPADLPSGPLGVTGVPGTGVAFDPGSATPVPYDGAPETPAAPSPAPAPAPAATPAAASDDPLAQFNAQIAEQERIIDGMIGNLPNREDIILGQVSGLQAGVSPQEQALLDQAIGRRSELIAQRDALATAQAADAAAAAQEAEQAEATRSRMEPLINDALGFLLDDQGNIRTVTSQVANVSGFGAGLFPGVNAADARLARAAVTELGAIAAMNSVREAREAGFGGSLSDADILLIQRSGGTFDLSQPEATARTLQRLQNEMNASREGWQDVGNGIRIRVRD